MIIPEEELFKKRFYIFSASDARRSLFGKGCGVLDAYIYGLEEPAGKYIQDDIAGEMLFQAPVKIPLWYVIATVAGLIKDKYGDEKLKYGALTHFSQPYRNNPKNLLARYSISDYVDTLNYLKDERPELVLKMDKDLSNVPMFDKEGNYNELY